MQTSQDTLHPPILSPAPIFKSIFASNHQSSIASEPLNADYRTTRVMLIPGWIYKYLIKNKVNIIDINNYKVVKQFLSMDDIADWVVINDSLHLFETGRKYRVSSQDMTHGFRNITDDELKLLYKISSASLNKDEMKERLNTRITFPSAITPDDYKPYKVINTTDTVIVVLDEGFIEYLNISFDNISAFTRSVLQECYRISKIQDVSGMDLFRLYVRLL